MWQALFAQWVKYAGAGLTATTALVFAVDRISRLYCETADSVGLESVLYTVLNPDRTLTAYRHSGVRSFRVETMTFGCFTSQKTRKPAA